MNDALCRGAWDKGCTDIMYMTIEYPNNSIISPPKQPRGNCVNFFIACDGYRMKEGKNKLIVYY